MARIEELQNKQNIATKALEKLNRQLARGGSCLQQKKNANRVRSQLEKIRGFDEQLRQTERRGGR